MIRAGGCAALVFCTLLIPSAQASQKGWRVPQRQALVVGNADYETQPLENPKSDAGSIAAALKNIGFEVDLRTDTTKEGLERAIREFGARLRERSAIGFFYYAGHAVQFQDQNWLIPVKNSITYTEDVMSQGVRLGDLMQTIARSDALLTVVVLDACRNNPFKARTRGSLVRGLIPEKVPKSAKLGTAIAYSTAAGEAALDDSRYAEALKSFLVDPELTLAEVFQKTGSAVQRATKAKQEPWLSSSIYEAVRLADPSWAPEGMGTELSSITKPIPTEQPTRAYRIAGWTSLGLTAVSAAVGAIYLSKMMGHLNQEDQLFQMDLEDRNVRSALLNQRASAIRDANVGRNALIASGATLLSAAVFFFVDYLIATSEPSPALLSPSPGASPRLYR